MEDLNIGDEAPDFTVPSTNDVDFTLSEHVKKGAVLLYFYVVNYRKTCTNYMALVNETKPEFDRLGVTLVHTNPETVENHKLWIEHTGAQYEHLSDTDQLVSESYGAIVERAKNEKIIGYTNRVFFFVGTDMHIKYIWRAYMPMDTLPMGELVAEIEKVLS